MLEIEGQEVKKRHRNVMPGYLYNYVARLYLDRPIIIHGHELEWYPIGSQWVRSKRMRMSEI